MNIATIGCVARFLTGSHGGYVRHEGRGPPRELLRGKVSPENPPSKIPWGSGSMLLMPSIDLRGGRCVRLRQGDFSAETAYAVKPTALLRRYQSLGARWVHVVDLDGAKDGVRLNSTLIETLARHPAIRLQVGGGARSTYAIEALLDAGVGRVVVGSAAVERPSEVRGWLEAYGAERICLAFDVRIDGAGEPSVHTQGWARDSVVSLWDALGAWPPRGSPARGHRGSAKVRPAPSRP